MAVKIFKLDENTINLNYRGIELPSETVFHMIAADTNGNDNGLLNKFKFSNNFSVIKCIVH